MGKLFTVDGGAAIHQALIKSGEPPIQLIKDYFGDKPSMPLSVSELFAVNEERYRYQQEYMDYWNDSAKLTGTGRAVDFVLLPIQPGPSFQPGRGINLSYTTIVNCLDYTAAVVPWGQVDKSVDVKDLNYMPINDLDKTIQSHYDPEIFDGSPTAIQIMGRRFQEEQVLAGARVIDEMATGFIAQSRL